MSLDDELAKLPKLIAVVGDAFDGAKHSLCNGGTADDVGQGLNLLLDLPGQPQHAHDLSHPGAGEALLSGDLGLAGDLSWFQEGLPLDGLAEELDNPGCLGFPGWYGKE